jgi:hypothetical protein
MQLHTRLQATPSVLHLSDCVSFVKLRCASCLIVNCAWTRKKYLDLSMFGSRVCVGDMC